MSFLKPRASFSSNFSSLCNFMRDNSTVLFHLKLYQFSTKGTHQVQIFTNFPGFPLVGGGGGLGDGGIPPNTRKIGLSPSMSSLTILTQKCQFYNFHAVFGHFAQIVPPPLVDHNWETLLSTARTKINQISCHFSSHRSVFP